MSNPEKIKIEHGCSELRGIGPRTGTCECDSWVCCCGNTPDGDGFYPCDVYGRSVEPTKEEWNGRTYVCAECGRIINQHTLEVEQRIDATNRCVYCRSICGSAYNGCRTPNCPGNSLAEEAGEPQKAFESDEYLRRPDGSIYGRK